ncbi:hypothetical protein BLA29_009954 [Euroglyphus maynei]|uniref:Uncharacterized protein n=1 Tax=Euroglyphus maynei TaxID=6958 RepID=A0A1Y3AMU3_EURMA|nr:hypothetical protein BLA29_009954 [Euroglyphus maynei]
MFVVGFRIIVVVLVVVVVVVVVVVGPIQFPGWRSTTKQYFVQMIHPNEKHLLCIAVVVVVVVVSRLTFYNNDDGKFHF